VTTETVHGIDATKPKYTSDYIFSVLGVDMADQNLQPTTERKKRNEVVHGTF
jgi:hypothetical protein